MRSNRRLPDQAVSDMDRGKDTGTDIDIGKDTDIGIRNHMATGTDIDTDIGIDIDIDIDTGIRIGMDKGKDRGIGTDIGIHTDKDMGKGIDIRIRIGMDKDRGIRIGIRIHIGSSRTPLPGRSSKWILHYCIHHFEVDFYNRRKRTDHRDSCTPGNRHCLHTDNIRWGWNYIPPDPCSTRYPPKKYF